MNWRQGKHGGAAVVAAIIIAMASLLGGVAARADETAIVGGNGGTYFSEPCDAGSYLVGFQVRSGDLLDQIAPQCAKLDASGNLTLPPKTGAPHGGSGGGAPQVYGCGSDHMIAASFTIVLTRGSNPSIDNIRFYCFVATDLSHNIFSTDILTGDGTYNENGQGENGLACPTGEAPIGLTGKAGDVVYGLGLLCGPSPATAIASGAVAATPPPPQFPTPTFGPRQATKTTTDALTIYAAMIEKSGEQFTDLNAIPWAPAARAAQSICDYYGYIGGFFTGKQSLGGTYTYGLVCSGSALHAPIQGAIFGGIETSGRAEASAAATQTCAGGIALAMLLGSDGTMPLPPQAYAIPTGSYYGSTSQLDMLCFVEHQNADSFQATDGDLKSAGLTSTSIEDTIWAAVARAADTLCHRRGANYVGGFFDGIEDAAARTHELACVGTPRTFLSKPGDASKTVVLGTQAPPSVAEPPSAGAGNFGNAANKLGVTTSTDTMHNVLHLFTKLGKSVLAEIDPGNFAGNWQTTVNGTMPGTLTLSDLRDTWTGTYTTSGVTGSISKGAVQSNGHLTFLWTNPGNVTGHGDFVLTGPDSFTGTFYFDANPGAPGTWNGHR